jgi:hypothetical protein
MKSIRLLCPEAGVLKTLSLAGYRGLRVHDSRWTQPANSQLIPQNMIK